MGINYKLESVYLGTFINSLHFISVFFFFFKTLDQIISIKSLTKPLCTMQYKTLEMFKRDVTHLESNLQYVLIHLTHMKSFIIAACCTLKHADSAF